MGQSRLGQFMPTPDTDTRDQSRSLICAQVSIASRAVLTGLASQASAAACLVRSIISAKLLLAASPRFSIAALRSFGMAALTASMSAGSVASASAAIGTSTTWKRCWSW